jgi:uncharacterized protein
MSQCALSHGFVVRRNRDIQICTPAVILEDLAFLTRFLPSFYSQVLLPGELTPLCVFPRPARLLDGAAEISMFIGVRELEFRPLDFREEIRPGVIDLGPDIRQKMPLETSGHADLVEEHHGKHQIIKDIRLKGDLTTRLELLCARCLEPLEHDVSRKFDLLYRPQGTDARAEELSVTDAEAEIGYYRGEGLELDDVLREQVLLALPLKVLCREDCKGLCPHCGMNLNEDQCSCTWKDEDPRWAALKDIKKKLQQ